MAVKASIQITISKVIDVYAVYRYYKLQLSTLAKPSKPTVNPPSGWSDTEPAYVSGSTNTLYFVDCNVYSDKSFSFSEVSKSSSYEAAKDAWNKANNAQESIDNLEIGGRNLARKTSSEWTNWWVPTANKVNICTVLSYIYPGSIKVGDIFTVSFDIDIKKFTKSVDGNLKVFIQGSVDGSWTIVNPFSRYDITNKITSNDCTEHITYIAKIGSEAQASSSKFDFGIRCDYSDGTGKLRLKNLKVERGNKATDWTPAPEDAISTVSTEYYLSTSATSLSGGSWSTTAPTWVNGKYMWSRTVTIDGVGNKTYSPSQNGVCIAGAKGDTGTAGKGVKSIVEQYYKSTSATSLSGGSWSTTYPGWENGKYIWTRSIITYTDNTSTTTTAVCVTGAKGSTGATGNGISKIEEHYAVSSSNSTAPTSWSSTVPTMTTTNKYLWNYETITYTSGSTVDTTKRVIGVYGNTGSKGDTGMNGKSIGSVINYYLATSASSNVTTDTSGWTTTVQSVSASKKYLWNYEVVKYSDGTTASTTTPCIIGAYGDTGAKGDKGETGATGKGVKSSAVTYQASTSGTTIPTGTWQASIPSVSAGSFLWTKTTITYTDNTSTTSYSVGKMGNTGSAGKGIKSTTITYQTGASGTTAPTGTWQSTIPTVSAGSYLWTRTVITYTDNTTSTSYSVGKMGNTGAAGKDAITISATAPTSPKTNQLWQTASGKPIKRWDGSKWVLYYVSVENLDVDTLSAITANLGTVTAGVLKSKDDVTKFDVANGVLESFDNETLQTLRLSAGGIKYIGKDASTNQMVSYLTFRGLVVRNINNRYGCSITLDESFDDFTVTKLINNGQGTDTVPLFSSLKQVPVSGTKVLSLTKGTNYVKLFTAAEVAALLGTSSGNADHAMISVANGDAKAFNARVFGAEYWSDSDAWWVYFNSAASITQPVRINYMITRIDQ